MTEPKSDLISNLSNILILVHLVQNIKKEARERNQILLESKIKITADKDYFLFFCNVVNFFMK